MGRGHRFGAVADEFARDERVLHAHVAHRQAVAHGDGRKDDRHTAGQGHPLLDRFGDLVEVHVPRNDVVLGVDDADERLADFFVAQAERLQKAALGSGIDAFGKRITTHDCPISSVSRGLVKVNPRALSK